MIAIFDCSSKEERTNRENKIIMTLKLTKLNFAKLDCQRSIVMFYFAISFAHNPLPLIAIPFSSKFHELAHEIVHQTTSFSHQSGELLF